MPGLYLPKSVREVRERQEAQWAADEYSKTLPDFKDAMALQVALRARDKAMSVTWAKDGPNMNRWVVIRVDGDGMPHLVRVIANSDGSYRPPSVSDADKLIDLWGSAGRSLLREVEAREAARRKEAEDRENANNAEIAERIASAVMKHNGVKDNALFTSEKTEVLR